MKEPLTKPIELKSEPDLNWRDRAKLKRGMPLPEIIDAASPRPEPPDWMGEEARAHWDTFLDRVMALNVYADSDYPALCDLVQTFADWLREKRKLDAEGSVLQGAKGTPIRNPRVTVVKDYLEAHVRLLRAFGMTPAARTTVRETRKLKPTGSASKSKRSRFEADDQLAQ